MITLFRWIRLWKLKIKWQLTVYTFFDQAIKEINTSELKDKGLKELMAYMAEISHASAGKEAEKTTAE